jgi:hypothetical protein
MPARTAEVRDFANQLRSFGMVEPGQSGIDSTDTFEKTPRRALFGKNSGNAELDSLRKETGVLLCAHQNNVDGGVALM